MYIFLLQKKTPKAHLDLQTFYLSSNYCYATIIVMCSIEILKCTEYMEALDSSSDLLIASQRRVSKLIRINLNTLSGGIVQHYSNSIKHLC